MILHFKAPAVPNDVLSTESDKIPESIEFAQLWNHEKTVAVVKSKNDIISRENVLKCIDDYCLEHLDKFVNLVCTGDCNESAISVELLFGYKTFCISNRDNCVWAAIANGLYALDGDAKAREICFSGKMFVKFFGQSSSLAGVYN